MSLHSPFEDDDLFAADFDLSQIFIGREEQLDQFSFYLERWIRLAEKATYSQLNTAPSPNDKIQGMVVLLYGRGGFGKTTLLKRYHEIALEYKQELTASKIVDWEFAAQERRTLFNPAPGEGVDALEYFNLLRNHLADALGIVVDDFKDYQVTTKAVEDARKQAAGVLDGLKRDNRYAWLGGLASEVVLALARLNAPVSNVVLSNKEMTQKAKELVGAGVEIGAEQIEKLWTKLHDKLGVRLDNYLEPALKLGLSLGRDLASFAEERPLLIFFDTYEEVDEADKFLRLVMGAAGVRVGWVIAGRDNLWAGLNQRLRSMETEYGYKDVVMSDRRFAVDFSADGVGDFSLSDIEEYFALLCAMRRRPSLPIVSEKEAAHILAVTQGVPLAVKIAAGLYLEKPDLKAITEDVDSRREIVDQMVRRYLIHTRTNQADRALLYGLALLRRSDQPIAIAAALNHSTPASYEAELSRLHRRYGFIFSKNEQPSLHQEVRHFLRLWLLEHRTEPGIGAINQRLKDAHQKVLGDLDEQRKYFSLRERMKDDQWIGSYLDLCEQQFWLEPVNGVELVLPFMMAASIYHRDANREVAKIGKFFESAITQPHRRRWEWAAQSLVYSTSRNPLPQELTGLEELVKLAGQSCPNFTPPIQDYRWELEAALWWRLGEAYRGRNEDRALEWYEKALERLEQVSELETDADVNWDSNYKNDLAKKDDEGEIVLNQAFEAKPDSVTAYLDEAKASANRGIPYRDFKKYQRSIEDLNHTLQLKPTDAKVYANRGNSYYYLKEFRRAIQDFDQALKLKPKLAYVYNDRGNAYYSLNEYERAIQDFDRSIELNPKDALAYNSRGLMYTELKEYERAIQDFDRAIKLDPNFALTYYNRGDAYYYLNEYERAIQDFNSAIEFDPKNAWAYYNRGKAYFYLNEYERAIQDFDRSIELDPNVAVAYFNRGLSYGNLKEYQRAIQDYDRAIELDPQFVRAYNKLGLAYAELNEYQRAIQDYDRAIQLDPKDADSYNSRGLAYAELNEYEQAIQNYDRAIQLDPNYIWAYYNRGIAYTNLNEYQRAIQDYDRAIELDPIYDRAYTNRGLTYFWLSDVKQAESDYALSWQLDSTSINSGWMIEWSRMCQERADQSTAERLETIAAIDSQNYIAYICRGVALWIREHFHEALVELDLAIPLDREQWDAYFWKGMVCASLGRDEEAFEALEQALKVELPPVLLSPLYWLEQDKPDFYKKYALPLLIRYR